MIPLDNRFLVRLVDMLMVRWLLRGADRILVLTASERYEIRHLLGREAKVERLPNGVPSQPNPTPKEKQYRPEVLYCARLEQRKRPDAFAEMAHLLTIRGVSARYRVVGPDQGSLQSLNETVARLGLGDRLSYEGSCPHDEVMQHMARADVYVLPSIDEPFPMSLLEALSLGVPSVCTDSCGISDDLRREEAAIVSDPSSSALADAVEHLLCNRDARERLSQAGRRTVETIFSMRATGDKLEEIYATVCGCRIGP
jgi:glycosyltransferase involved in cell wall biosynthesis